MEERKCEFCSKKLPLDSIVTSSSSGKLFCGTTLSPLEPDSCALKYLSNQSKDINSTYFFVKLGE